MVERVSDYVLIGKLRARTMKEAARRTIAMVRKYQPPEKRFHAA